MTVHLLAANVAGAGPLFSAWLGRRSLRGDDSAGRLGRQLARWSVAALVIAGISGGLQFLLPGGGLLLAAASRVPASDWWIVLGEVGFSLLFSSVLIASWRGGRFRSGWGWTAAVLTSTNLLYHFPPLMSVVSNLKADPFWAVEEVIPRSAFRGLMTRPEVVSVWVHFVLASVAIVAVLVVWMARHEKEAGTGTAAARVALLITLLQIPIGVWVLFSSRDEMTRALMGGSAVHTAALVAGIASSIGLLHQLGVHAIGDRTESVVNRAAGLTLLTALLMAVVLSARDL